MVGCVHPHTLPAGLSLTLLPPRCRPSTGAEPAPASEEELAGSDPKEVQYRITMLEEEMGRMEVGAGGGSAGHGGWVHAALQLVQHRWPSICSTLAPPCPLPCPPPHAGGPRGH